MIDLYLAVYTVLPELPKENVYKDKQSEVSILYPFLHLESNEHGHNMHG